MKEITMVVTCEITSVAVVTDEDAVFVETRDIQCFKDQICKEIKDELNADDANVLNVQFFIRDLPDQ